MPLEQSAVATVEAPIRERREQTSTRPKRQPNYHVIIWDDDVHSPLYVVELLIELFGHQKERAIQIMEDVHYRGKGIATTCHQELAELKRDQVRAYGADPYLKGISHRSIRATIEPAPE